MNSARPFRQRVPQIPLVCTRSPFVPARRLSVTGRAPVGRNGRQRGASMVESLVGLFVLSVGLLGMAAMQQVGLRYAHTAHLRGQATALAGDIIDRMRANRVRALAGDYALPRTAAAQPAEVCPASGSAAQVECDLAEWAASIGERLPLGEGSIERIANADGTHRIRVSIRWRERRERPSDADEAGGYVVFRTETQL